MTLPNKYDWKKLQLFCQEVFEKAGVLKKNAEIVADSLIQADLRGVDSHGVVRTAIYVERIEKNMINPFADPEIEAEDTSTVLVNGNNNLGAVVGTKAVEIAMEKAKANGAAIVGVKGSNHFGTGAFYTLKAIEKDMILLVMSNASQTMPPTGGKRPFIGTNPLAIGVPAGKEAPFILDMATSVVARGKIIVASQKGQDIPLGWAVDKNGKPTTNADDALEGAVLPVGGPKGYAISMFIDILAGVLTGAGFGKYVHNMYENWDEPQNVGHIFIAIDINRFIPIELFKERIDRYISEIKAEPKADGVEEILIPGEIEFRKVIERKKNGIELPEKVAAELDNIGQRYGVDLAKAVFSKNEFVNQEEVINKC
ncbi:Ldh family oxidoreductase [Neobacillus cucumis]|uniref:Ldh family oxidoreductase n=1 Tax=Neobacillus cucumis TaxID=1740721 RepID=UPI0019656117|nr:Ldh family oxidoreductase [Neobacillus cucumis]MBM7651819.1 LDH2 family malate/lactate/ureidoglycolate dehydrogenase [Neobacillus cucumis]